MIEHFRYWLSANLIRIGIDIIPNEPVRMIMQASIARGARDIEAALEGVGSD
jgi:hypothetical protein